jgi:hypothetical protein
LQQDRPGFSEWDKYYQAGDKALEDLSKQMSASFQSARKSAEKFAEKIPKQVSAFIAACGV